MAKIEVQCPTCERRLRMSDALCGTIIECTACTGKMRIPAKRQSRTAAAEAENQPKPTDAARPSRPAARKRRPSQAEKPSPRQRRTRPKRTQKPPANDQFIDDQQYDSYGAVEDYDDYGDADWNESPYDQPPARRKKKKKKKQSRNGGKLIATIFMALGGVGALGAVGFLAWEFVPSLMSSAAAGSELGYLDESTTIVARIQVDDTLNSSLVQEYLAADPTTQQKLTQMRDDIGMGPEDIESLTMGLSPKSGPGSAASPFALLSQSNRLIIVRLNTATDYFSRPGIETTTIGSETVYNTGPDEMTWMPDRYTVISGNEASVTSAIQRGHQDRSFPNLRFVEWNHDIVLGVSGQTIKSALQQFPAIPGDQTVQSVATLFRDHVDGVSATVDYSSQIDFGLQFSCDDSASASELKGYLEQFRTKGQEAAKLGSASMKPGKASQVNNLIESLQITTSGTTVSVTVSIDEATFNELNDSSSNGSSGLPFLN